MDLFKSYPLQDKKKNVVGKALFEVDEESPSNSDFVRNAHAAVTGLVSTLMGGEVVRNIGKDDITSTTSQKTPPR